MKYTCFHCRDHRSFSIYPLTKHQLQAPREGTPLKTRDVIIGHLETIDEAWGKAKPFVVTDYIAGLAAIPTNDLALLLCADLEWRWRSMPTSSSNAQPNRILAAPLSDGSLAIVEDYLAAFPQIAASQTALTALIESEFVARSRWHTPPLISDFRNRFPGLSTELDHSLVRVLDDMAPLEIRVLDGRKLGKSTAVQSGVVLGRSTQQEEPLPHYQLPENLLFVAGPNDKATSRKQLQLDRIAYDRVSVTNLSQSVTVLVGRNCLEPNGVAYAYLPIIVGWANHRVGIELGKAS